MKKNHSQKRGFTLVEVVITLAVTIILMTTISSLIVAVVSERRRSVGDYNVSNDLYFAENAVYDWFYNFAGSSYTLSSETDANGNTYGVAAIVNDGDTGDNTEYKISFDAENKKLITPKYTNGLSFLTISNVTFNLNGDVITVNITYDGASVPVSLLLSGRKVNENP